MFHWRTSQSNTDTIQSTSIQSTSFHQNPIEFSSHSFAAAWKPKTIGKSIPLFHHLSAFAWETALQSAAVLMQRDYWYHWYLFPISGKNLVSAFMAASKLAFSFYPLKIRVSEFGTWNRLESKQLLWQRTGQASFSLVHKSKYGWGEAFFRSPSNLN